MKYSNVVMFDRQLICYFFEIVLYFIIFKIHIPMDPYKVSSKNNTTLFLW